MLQVCEEVKLAAFDGDYFLTDAKDGYNQASKSGSAYSSSLATQSDSCKQS